MNLRTGIIEAANELGMDPTWLATIISYETGGTMDPLSPGPTTKWGQHRGLIQFGEPQAREHGVSFKSRDEALKSQLGPNGGIVSYFRRNGWKPGMSFEQAYATVNAGDPNLVNASDEAAGGAPGTVRDKVNNQMAGHWRRAQAIMGNENPDSVPLPPSRNAPGGTSAQYASLGPQSDSKSGPPGNAPTPPSRPSDVGVTTPSPVTNEFTPYWEYLPLDDGTAQPSPHPTKTGFLAAMDREFSRREGRTDPLRSLRENPRGNSSTRDSSLRSASPSTMQTQSNPTGIAHSFDPSALDRASGEIDATREEQARLAPPRSPGIGHDMLPPPRPQGVGAQHPLPPSRPNDVGTQHPLPPSRPHDIGAQHPMPPPRPHNTGFDAPMPPPRPPGNAIGVPLPPNRNNPASTAQVEDILRRYLG